MDDYNKRGFTGYESKERPNGPTLQDWLDEAQRDSYCIQKCVSEVTNRLTRLQALVDQRRPLESTKVIAYELVKAGITEKGFNYAYDHFLNEGRCPAYKEFLRLCKLGDPQDDSPHFHVESSNKESDDYYYKTDRLREKFSKVVCQGMNEQESLTVLRRFTGMWHHLYNHVDIQDICSLDELMASEVWRPALTDLEKNNFHIELFKKNVPKYMKELTGKEPEPKLSREEKLKTYWKSVLEGKGR